MDLERFGRIVFNRRTELGLTQEGVSQNGGPTDTTMGKIENGEWTPGNRKVTLRKLDVGLRWAPGSAARTLAGGDPTPLSDEADEFLSKIRHPRYSAGVSAGLDKGDKDLLSVLEEVLQTGALPDNAQEQLERLRDDAVIEQFPKRYDALSRGRKLRVAWYGNKVWIEQVEEEKKHAVETAPESSTSPPEDEDKEGDRSLDESKDRLGRGLDPGGDWGENPDQRQHFS